MRGTVLAGVGIGVACVFLLLSPAASAERQLAKSGALTATVPDGSLCRPSLPITVHASERSAFDDPVALEKLVGAIRVAATFECEGKPIPQRLVITGQAASSVVYRGRAEAAQQWMLVGTTPEPMKTAGEGKPANDAPERLPPELPPADAARDPAAQDQPGDIAGDPFMAAPVSSPILVELMMAARPDLYRSDSIAVWELARSMPGGGPACKAAYKRTQDEFGRAEFVAEARKRLAEALAAAGRAGPVRLVKIAIDATLEDYDANRRAFPLSGVTYGDQTIMTWPPNGARDVPLGCTIAVGDRHSGGDISQVFRRFSPRLSFTGSDLIHDLPMAKDAARTFVQRLTRAKKKRQVKVEAVIEARADVDGITGRVVAARAMDPVDGKVLHVYAPAAFAPVTTAAPEDLPATPEVMGLAAVRALPGVLSDLTVQQITKRRVGLEKFAYDQAGTQAAAGRKSFHVFTVEELQERPHGDPAPDLVPRTRAYVDALTHSLPERLWFEVRHELVHDPASGRMGRPSGSFPLLDKQQVDADREQPSDPRLDELSAYAVPRVYARQPSVQQQAAGDLGQGLLPVVNTIYFDRLLETDGFTLGAEQADRLARWVPKLPHVPELPSVKITFSVIGAVSAARSGGNAVLLARLGYVALLDPDGNELSRLSADTFPLAEVRRKEEAQAANEAALAAAIAAADAARAQAKRADDAARARDLAVEQATNDVRDAALAAIGGTVYGPDIVGIRLGMRFTEAEELIRQHMEVGWVLATPASTVDTNGPKFTSLKVFVRADKQEVIALLDQPPGAAERVLGVRRTLQVPRDMPDEQLIASLSEKYGTPAKRKGLGSPGRVTWAAPGKDLCEASIPGGLTKRPRLLEGTGEDLGSGAVDSHLGFRHDAGPSTPQGKINAVAKCGPEILVDRRQEKLMITLADDRIQAALAASRGALSPTWTPKQQTRRPELKF